MAEHLTKVLYARIDHAVYDRLGELAETTGMSIARVAERVIIRGLGLPDVDRLDLALREIGEEK